MVLPLRQATAATVLRSALLVRQLLMPVAVAVAHKTGRQLHNQLVVLVVAVQVHTIHQTQTLSLAQ
jgi:hypothetical protein